MSIIYESAVLDVVNTLDSIDEIASRHGFESVHHLNEVFVKEFFTTAENLRETYRSITETRASEAYILTHNARSMMDSDFPPIIKGPHHATKEARAEAHSIMDHYIVDTPPTLFLSHKSIGDHAPIKPPIVAAPVTRTMSDGSSISTLTYTTQSLHTPITIVVEMRVIDKKPTGMRGALDISTAARTVHSVSGERVDMSDYAMEMVFDYKKLFFTPEPSYAYTTNTYRTDGNHPTIDQEPQKDLEMQDFNNSDHHSHMLEQAYSEVVERVQNTDYPIDFLIDSTMMPSEYFYTRFALENGISPSEYREMYKPHIQNKVTDTSDLIVDLEVHIHPVYPNQGPGEIKKTLPIVINENYRYWVLVSISGNVTPEHNSTKVLLKGPIGDEIRRIVSERVRPYFIGRMDIMFEPEEVEPRLQSPMSTWKQPADEMTSRPTGFLDTPLPYDLQTRSMGPKRPGNRCACGRCG